MLTFGVNEFSLLLGLEVWLAANSCGPPVSLSNENSVREKRTPSVTFNWSLTAADIGALGITIQELALFANHASAGLPGTTAPTPMLARKTIAPIVFGAGMSISGTWTLTF